MIAVTFDTATLARKMQKHAEQIPYATRLAVNETAKKIQTALKIEARFAFDRPTAFTVNAPMVRFARRGEIEAEVFLRNEATKGTPPVKYLSHNVRGGGRLIKPFEAALIASGIVNRGEMVVPAAGVKLNAYGNVSQGTIVRLLTALKSSRDESGIGLGNNAGASRKRKPGRIFYSRGPDGARQTLKRGIYQTSGKFRIKPIFNIVPAAKYGIRFRFAEIARQANARAWPTEFKKALRTAIRTAR